MTTLFYTVGLPASGKSTWAKAWQAEHPTTRTRANRDDLRAMLHGSKWSGNNEKQVVAIQNAIIADSLSRGRDVVVIGLGAGRIDVGGLIQPCLRGHHDLAKATQLEVLGHIEFLG